MAGICYHTALSKPLPIIPIDGNLLSGSQDDCPIVTKFLFKSNFPIPVVCWYDALLPTTEFPPERSRLRAFSLGQSVAHWEFCMNEGRKCIEVTRKQKESKQGKQYIVLRIRYGVQDKGASIYDVRTEGGGQKITPNL